MNERGRDHYVGSDRDLDKLFQAELGRPPSPVDMAAVDKTTLDRYLKSVNLQHEVSVVLQWVVALIGVAGVRSFWGHFLYFNY